MVFVNLLRCDTESGETGLSEVFQEALRDGRRRLREERGLELQLSMCNFDWHRLRKELGMPLAVPPEPASPPSFPFPAPRAGRG